MRLYTKVIGVYKFNELSVDARNKAIDDHRCFLLSIMRPDDFISGDPEYDTPEKLQKTYESEYDYYLMNNEPIEESIEVNDYDFYESGDIVGPQELLSMTEIRKEVM